MKRVLPPFVGDPGAIGLLAMRMVAGLGLILHGYPKLVHLYSWMPATSSVPPLVQAAIPLVQVIGGACLIFGFLTPIAAMCITIQMGYAVHYFQSKGDIFVAPMRQTGTSYETALLYMMIGFLFLMTGPGRHALDYYIFGGARGRSVEDEDSAEPAEPKKSAVLR